jgi:hypothetical protein
MARKDKEFLWELDSQVKGTYTSPFSLFLIIIRFCTSYVVDLEDCIY